MAEFIDIIYTIQRICKQRNGQCPTCLLGEFACPNNVRFDKTEEAAFRELEDVVTKWAAEHPEPVYPTWGEWLESLEVVEVTKTKDRIITVMMKPELLNPIPADIAQKLGIEPKEGSRGA